MTERIHKQRLAGNVPSGSNRTLISSKLFTTGNWLLRLDSNQQPSG